MSYESSNANAAAEARAAEMRVADARVAEARANAHRPWYKKIWSWVLAIIGIIIIILLLSRCGDDSSSTGDTAVGGNSNNNPSGNTTNSNSPGEVKGSSDASADTDSVSCGSLDALGILHPTVTVTNRSSDTSNYLITISAVSSVDNTVYADAAVSINGLQPNGNTTEASVFLLPVPSDAVCKVTSIVRVGT